MPGSIEQLAGKMATRYVLKQASTRKEMDGIMHVIWAANYNPYDPFAQLLFPVLGFLPSDYETAIAESQERFWNNHLSDASSHWLYIEEVRTGKPVGCAQWEVHLRNPFSDGPPSVRAPWWPKGEHRQFCELILNQVYKTRASWMVRPHLALNWMAVDPDHRRRGVGTLLMAAGLELADKLNVETWMEASSMGRPLYENHGFRSLSCIAFDTEKPDASDVWRRCEHEITPQPCFAMWRPRQGLWEVEGLKVEMPWNLGPQCYETDLTKLDSTTAAGRLLFVHAGVVTNGHECIPTLKNGVSNTLSSNGCGGERNGSGNDTELSHNHHRLM